MLIDRNVRRWFFVARISPIILVLLGGCVAQNGVQSLQQDLCGDPQVLLLPPHWDKFLCNPRNTSLLENAVLANPNSSRGYYSIEVLWRLGTWESEEVLARLAEDLMHNSECSEATVMFILEKLGQGGAAAAESLDRMSEAEFEGCEAAADLIALWKRAKVQSRRNANDQATCLKELYQAFLEENGFEARQRIWTVCRCLSAKAPVGRTIEKYFDEITGGKAGPPLEIGPVAVAIYRSLSGDNGFLLVGLDGDNGVCLRFQLLPGEFAELLGVWQGVMDQGFSENVGEHEPSVGIQKQSVEETKQEGF